MTSTIPSYITSHDTDEPSTVAPVVPTDNQVIPTDNQEFNAVVQEAEVTVVTLNDGGQDKQYSLCKGGKKITWSVAATITTLILLGVVLGVFLSGKSSGDGNGNPVKTPSPASYEERFTVFRDALATKSDPSTFFDPDSPQSLALQWLVYQDQTISLDNLDRLTQRYVIMVLYYACGGENWRSYLTPLVEEVETNECDLKDFNCDEFGNVVAVDLYQEEMAGRLPEEIGLLTDLTELNLSFNDLEGSIPDSIYGLKNLSE